MKSRISFHTFDLFNIKDVKTRNEYFDFCHKEALKCGLTCKCIIEDKFTRLDLWGYKSQFLRYYLRTMIKWERKPRAVKRLLKVILWK